MVSHRQRFGRSPRFGVGRRGSPRFVPISPFSSDLFRFAFLVFGNTPICSDLLRFLPICFQNKSEQSEKPLSADPFCKSPIWGRATKFTSHRTSRWHRAILGHYRELRHICTTTTQKARKDKLQSETLVPSTPTVDKNMLAQTSKTIYLP